MAEDTDETPAIDAKRLIAMLRAGDERAIDQAYALTFGNELGRVVLAHHLMEMGVGNPIRAETDAELRMLVGRHNAALELAHRAHFGQAQIAVAVLTDNLETTYETEGNEPPAAVVDDFDEHE